MEHLLKSSSYSVLNEPDEILTESADDDKRIERAKTSPEAFGDLYDLYYGRILTFVYRQVLDHELAEDLTSNIFFNIFRALPRFRPETSFRSWIFRIAINEINLHRRSLKNRRKREKDFYDHLCLDRTYFSLTNLESDEELKKNMRQFARVHEALDTLPERYRTVLVLRFFEECTYEDIAQVLGKRIGTIKSLIHRGLKKMRKHFEGFHATI